MRERVPLPDKIKNAPQLWLGLEFYYGAFFDLSPSRQTAWEEGPIPWLAMDQYSRSLGLDDEQRSALFYLIRELDDAYLGFRRKQAESRRKAGKGGKSS